MAFTTCLECGGQISTQARTCPHCGYALNGRTSRLSRARQPLTGWFIALTICTYLAGGIAATLLVANSPFLVFITGLGAVGLCIVEIRGGVIRRLARLSCSCGREPWQAQTMTDVAPLAK